MFFNKYRDKQEGVIRSFDMGSPMVKIIAIVIFIICIVMVIVALFPSVWVFLASFKDIKEFRRNPTIFPSTFDIGKFIKTWHDLDFFQYYVNSLISVAGSVICAIFFNGLLAYGLGILKPKGHRVVFAMVMWSLLIPATTSLVALFVNINRIGLNGSFVPLWLAMGANAFFVILFKQFFEQLPNSLIEAATLDGCGNLQTFTKIVLPLSKPIMMVVAIFALNAAWSDFLLPFLLLANTPKETVMVRLFAFRTSNATDVEVLRAIAFSIIPPIVLFAVFQKQIMQNVVSAGIKG
jgi:multiple sugar transport system permease protein